MRNLVGSGSFGSVYKGIFEESGVVIAVNVLNLLDHRSSRSFLVECETLKNIRHRNLVKVLTAISGVDYQGNDFKALVYEFMINGSLEDWRHSPTGTSELETMRKLNFFQQVSVTIDVAHALEYLHHHCETSIIHCDLKPSNILLNEEMVGHISDFGLAKIISADELNRSTKMSSSLGLKGTIGYAPPEYGMGSELSTKGDVYSYGILLLEMFTGKRPTNERFRDGLSLHNFVKAALPEQIIEITDPILVEERVTRGTPDVKNLRNDRHLWCLNSLFEIGLACSAESPNDRIDMSDVVTKLCSIRDKILLSRKGLNLLGLAHAATVVRGNDTDLQALLQFKAMITGDQLKVMNSWNSSIHFCEWHGVTCGRNNRRVIKLELQFLKLLGSLSPFIGNLSFLKELNLASNNFHNQIPQEIGRLRRLETLQLSNNSITGEIPSNLSSCSKLTFVSMRGNQLTGEIPASLGLLANMKTLSFAINRLRGSIPPSFGNLTSPEALILRTNALSGVIPEDIGRLPNLSFFSVEENAISGIIC
ncbi:probable LRR receptor-like serine/threonine-protein kinase At3g47570 [Gossypium hirsutum]|uniref:Probable LRR receptor-like serine/threonine-protein kinase At3g47570 n=1 Tax=Gossypium hirsutum TaxID=3635 RepID=A0ABM3ATK8_GOSHI|nr:probable LRR receptor-like serine/threonine-protein kinase At3g47570 [Gossypium hirsutum]